ncbi:MAG: amidohydrolase [Clostridia bacterium]|nr:amidohydrolase [Clostridia bacterium]
MLDMLTRYRRDLHRIPEIMFDLPETRAYILNVLKDSRAQIEVTEKGGVTAFFDTGKPYALAFRADMDALTVGEQTGSEFSSKHAGCMHACGHDGHMAMLLALCGWLETHADELKCNVLAVFQPAEESGGGAEHIAKSGIFERLNVKGIYALHVDPAFPVGTIATRPGAFMAKSSEVYITVHGKASHAAEWQKGVDSLEACADLYLKLLAMERSIDPSVPRLLKFGLMKSGAALNIISDKTELTGTMRAFSMDTFNWMKEQLYRLAKECEEQYGVTVDIFMPGGYPPVINDESLFEKAKKALSRFDFVEMEKPEMLAEDFAFYLSAVPGIMMKLGVGGCEKLHSPHFMFDEEALVPGLEALTLLAQEG